MSKKPPDKFYYAPVQDAEPERSLPDQLELEDYFATTVAMPAGAYNPYEKPVGDTVRTPRPRPRDLRKLSEWIKLKQEVDALARENDPPDTK